MVAAYVEELRATLAEQRRDWIARRASIEHRLAELAQEDSRMVDAIVAGVPLESVRARAEAMAAEREVLRAELVSPEFDAIMSAAAHPSIADHYRRSVAELHLIAEGDEAARTAGRKVLGDLIDKIEVTPRGNGTKGTELVVHGKLAALLGMELTQKTPPERGFEDCTLKLVAGAGFEPATFRL